MNATTRDEPFENQLRPHSLEQFQGQREIKQNLKVFIQAALSRNDTLDHVFLSGPPGLGKTTLAGIMAREMKVDFKPTSAPALDKAKDLAGILTTLPKHGVLFIDELHRIKPLIEELLYIAMEDFELDWIVGQGPSARAIRIPIQPFTVVGATTKAGRISGPLLGRFGINARLDYYQSTDIEAVLRRSAKLMSITMEPAAVTLLASCSRGTPRIANRLLRRTRDFAQVEGTGEVDLKIVSHALRRLGIDEFGLEKEDRRLLKIITTLFSGGPVGVETLAASMGETVDTIEDYHEPYLIQRGLLKRTPRGRQLTPLAYQHIGATPPDRTKRGQKHLL